jgi:cyanophycin synthetase
MSRELRSAEHGTRLLELRVLDGPNRFFTRPAVKLEFANEQPGIAVESAASAGLAVRRLHVALGLPAPMLTSRRSEDDLRALIAFPWRRRTIGQAIGAAASRLALGESAEATELAALRAMALGPRPSLPRAHVPIVAVTGTNGKSTTSRLIAHVAASIGLAVGMTNSDGIYLRGELVEAGDWTGFGGARRVLSERGLQLAVLETARGGILLRGVGYAHDDIAVVTNISSDHLGLQGIDTLDELAEVKATIVRITRSAGWAVLNADDRRTWAMRRETPAHWYAFSMQPRTAAVEEAIESGGRAAVIERGWLVLLAPGRRPVRLVRAAELPLTLGGRARHNVANALAAAAACDALGFDHAAIAAGLRTFALDPESNPGRLNLYRRDGVLVVVDFAHNEAGLVALLDTARALTAGGQGCVRLALGTAGDRSDEVLRSLAEEAGRRSDDLLIAEKPHYLRGRSRENMNELLRAGAAASGMEAEVEVQPSEVAALTALLGRATIGDVVVVLCHAERDEVGAWLRGNGFAALEAAELSSFQR